MKQCVVAHDHLPLHRLDSIFLQAVRCAEAIGIFKWHCLEGQLTESDFQDYKNIAHCLYILDKKLCFTAGLPPRVLQSEVQLDLTPSDGSFKTIAVKAELATIEEAIHHQIYAYHAKNRTEAQVRDVVECLDHRVDAWLVKSGVDVEATVKQPENYPLHASLVFSGFCAKLLLISHFREHPDRVFQQTSSIATTCMSILISLWTSTQGAWKQVSVPLYVSHNQLSQIF